MPRRSPRRWSRRSRGAALLVHRVRSCREAAHRDRGPRRAGRPRCGGRRTDRGRPDGAVAGHGGVTVPQRPPERRPVIERVGLAAVAAVLAALFGGVAVAAWAGGEPFLGVMGL